MAVTTNDTYTIALCSGPAFAGVTQYDFYDNVTEVVDEFLTNDKIFIARLTSEQAVTLRRDRRVYSVDRINHLHSLREQDADNSLDVRRTSPYTTSYFHPGKGNWALHRHMSPTQNFVAEDTDYTMTFQYPQHGGVDVDGTGVDIVFLIDDPIAPDNPGYATNGTTQPSGLVSRVQEFQWNTLPGLGPSGADLEDVDYDGGGASDTEEARVAFACHDVYGWAKGAHIYVIPMDNWETETTALPVHEPYWWETIRLFHQSKVTAGGTVRPTIAVTTHGYNMPIVGEEYIGGTETSMADGFKKINFRGTEYTTYRGVSGLSRPGHHGDWRGFGIRAEEMRLAGGTGIDYWGEEYADTWPYDPDGVDVDGDGEDYLDTAGDPGLPGGLGGTVKSLVTAMENEGVFHVVSAGNKSQKLDVPGGPDYNNYFLNQFSGSTDRNPWEAADLDDEIYATLGEYVGTGDALGGAYYINREPMTVGPNAIMVANMDSSFNSIVPGMETLRSGSSRGPRIDCAIGASNLTLEQADWEPYSGPHEFFGSSFAVPQVAGILAMVLQKFPSTTPAQARKYFREHAIGTDKLYDSGISPILDGGDYGDPDYFGNPIGLQGYSGNILYLDPAMAFDPSTITDTTITYPPEILAASKINFTIDQINEKLYKVKL